MSTQANPLPIFPVANRRTYTEAQRAAEGHVEIILGGVQRWFICSFNAIAEIEEATNGSFMTAAFWQRRSAKAIKQIVCSLLKSDDPDLTPFQVGRMIGMGNLAYVMNRMTEAWTKRAPAPEDDEELPLPRTA